MHQNDIYYLFMCLDWQIVKVAIFKIINIQMWSNWSGSRLRNKIRAFFSVLLEELAQDQVGWTDKGGIAEECGPLF